jgi:mutator protein MutT
LAANLKAIDVAAALIFDRGKLLITQRRPDDHLPNLWEFPGGKVEPGETFAACLVREIREELGIEISVHQQFEDLTHSYPEKKVRLCFFNCRLISGEPKPIHVQDLRWVTREELRHYEFPAADGKLIDRLMAADWRQEFRCES